MCDLNLKPYIFARERFTHACRALTNEQRTVKERLLDAVIALSPLRPEDLPRACQVLHEKMQEIIGVSFWIDSATAGALPAAVRALTLQRAEAAAECIAMANATLDKYCGVQTAAMPFVDEEVAGQPD